jgi:tryptophan synthase alpha chain
VSAIAEVFARCRAERRPAFIPFIVAGDPDLETTGRLLFALARGGADIIEVGVPFSDPIADGPVNQRAATRALSHGTSLSDVLRLVAKHRDALGVPIVLFTYFNPIHARGVETFADQAAASGVDGVLCVDLPTDEAESYAATVHGAGLDTIFLLAPTSTPERMKRADQLSRGFVYYVSRAGVTGEREAVRSDLAKELKRVRKKVRLPLAVGFGISTRDQVREVAKVADGVVVGSALVRLIEEHAGAADLAGLLEAKVGELVKG